MNCKKKGKKTPKIYVFWLNIRRGTVSYNKNVYNATQGNLYGTFDANVAQYGRMSHKACQFVTTRAQNRHILCVFYVSLYREHIRNRSPLWKITEERGGRPCGTASGMEPATLRGRGHTPPALPYTPGCFYLRLRGRHFEPSCSVDT